ncbi:MAG: RNA polymerase sigma factor [Bacteroidales bacterium]|nr:RNA polymerase sigma factor [Bacteroidales bacterium]
MNSDNGHIETVVALCKQGENKGRKELFEMFSSSMKALCYRYVGNVQDAEDLMIEGFISVYENIDKYRQGNFVGWMKRIMINNCLMFLKKEKNYNKKNTDYFYQQNEEEVTVENEVRFTKQEIFKALDSLPKSFRTIFNLSVMDGYSHGEICQMLNVENITVRATLYKAKCMLKRELIKIEKQRK